MIKIGHFFTSQTITKIRHNQRFRLETTDFTLLVPACHFVDKTMIISELINDANKVLVTAPKRFGKTTTVSMLKQFATIEVNEKGEPLKPITEPVTGTPNHKIFCKELHGKKLEIMKEEHEEIVKQHFGRYPVILMDLSQGCEVKCTGSEETGYTVNIEERLKEIVHNAFKEHEYLQHSQYLEKQEQELCESWISANFTNSTCAPEEALQNLSYYLWKHFQSQKVWLLVDNYDKIINDTLFSLPETVAKDIVGKNYNLLSSVLKNDDYVERVFLTGVSQVLSFDFCKLNNIEPHMFLTSHKYSRFYGFSEQEVLEVFTRTGRFPEEISEISKYYHSYVTKGGMSVYDPWAVMNYIKTDGQFSRYYLELGFCKEFHDIYIVPCVQNSLALLLSDKSVKINIYRKWTLDHALKFKNVSLDNQEMHDLFFSLLFEKGYLSYKRVNSVDGDWELVDDSLGENEINNFKETGAEEAVSVKVPSRNLKYYLQWTFKSRYSSKLRKIFADSDKQECKDMFRSLYYGIDETEDKFVKSITNFAEKAQHLYNKYSQLVPLEISDASIYAFMQVLVGFSESFTIFSHAFLPNRRLGFVTAHNEFSIFFEFEKYVENNDRTNPEIAFRRVKGHCNIVNNRIGTRSCVMMGLSLNSTNVGLKCVRDKRGSDGKFSFETLGFDKLSVYEYDTKNA